MGPKDIKRIREAEKNDVVTKDGITLFWGGWPSQWYPSTFVIDGLEYNCAEQWMMWSKARFFSDEACAKKILEAKWPKAQKELGRTAKPYSKDWDEAHASRAIVLRGTLAKFRQDEELRKLLLATKGTRIAEASPYDDLWGIGLSQDDPRARDPSAWIGKNWLGLALMQARDILGDEVA